jgi:hypothetical protein
MVAETKLMHLAVGQFWRLAGIAVKEPLGELTGGEVARDESANTPGRSSDGNRASAHQVCLSLVIIWW